MCRFPLPSAGQPVRCCWSVCRSDLPDPRCSSFPFLRQGNVHLPVHGNEPVTCCFMAAGTPSMPFICQLPSVDIDGKIRQILFGGKADIQRLTEPVRRDAVTFRSPLSKRNCPLTPLSVLPSGTTSISLFFRLTCPVARTISLKLSGISSLRSPLTSPPIFSCSGYYR